jgi:hypothetical protein
MVKTVLIIAKMETVLSIPQNINVTETMTSTYWFDEDGILYSITKKLDRRPTHEESQVLLEDFKKMANGRKFCMVGDVTYTTPASKQERDEAARVIPQFVIAMALLSGSPMGRMLANLFFALKPPPYPCKMFGTEKEAKEWLQKYLVKKDDALTQTSTGH